MGVVLYYNSRLQVYADEGMLERLFGSDGEQSSQLSVEK